MNPRPRNWRNTIQSWLVFHAKALKLLPEGETTAARLPKHVLDVVAPLCDELLQAVSANAVHYAQIENVLERIINLRLWNALTPFSSVKLGAYQELDFDPYDSPESTRRWVDDLDRAMPSKPTMPSAFSRTDVPRGTSNMRRA